MGNRKHSSLPVSLSPFLSPQDQPQALMNSLVFPSRGPPIHPPLQPSTSPQLPLTLLHLLQPFLSLFFPGRSPPPHSFLHSLSTTPVATNWLYRWTARILPALKLSTPVSPMEQHKRHNRAKAPSANRHDTQRTCKSSLWGMKLRKLRLRWGLGGQGCIQHAQKPSEMI